MPVADVVSLRSRCCLQPFILTQYYCGSYCSCVSNCCHVFLSIHKRPCAWPHSMLRQNKEHVKPSCGTYFWELTGLQPMARRIQKTVTAPTAHLELGRHCRTQEDMQSRPQHQVWEEQLQEFPSLHFVRPVCKCVHVTTAWLVSTLRMVKGNRQFTKLSWRADKRWYCSLEANNSLP